MRILVLLLITLLGCGDVQKQHDHKGKTPLVEVMVIFYYKEDLMSVLPVGLSKMIAFFSPNTIFVVGRRKSCCMKKLRTTFLIIVDVEKLVGETTGKALIMHTYQQETD